MGRWSKLAKKNTIHTEIFNRLNTMYTNGKNRSRHKDKQNKVDLNYIYTQSTFETYKRECNKFHDYIRKNHPDVKHLSDCKKYVNEYLQSKIDDKKSAYSICTYRAALCKLFNTNEFIPAPPRRRKDIKRSRVPVPKDKHISIEKNNFYASVTSCTGLRIRELLQIKGSDLYFDDDGNAWLNITRGTKGGKHRRALIYSPDEKELKDVIRMFQMAGNSKVFAHVPDAFDNHHYRGDYAKRIYEYFARPLDAISRSEKYFMRADRKGDCYDRVAMQKTSEMLGHNRIDVIAQSYLY